jgi:hypothetical protein
VTKPLFDTVASIAQCIDISDLQKSRNTLNEAVKLLQSVIAALDTPTQKSEKGKKVHLAKFIAGHVANGKPPSEIAKLLPEATKHHINPGYVQRKLHAAELTHGFPKGSLSNPSAGP